MVEARIAGELRHVLGALRVIAVLGRDGRERDPVLQHLDRRVVLRGDLGDHRIAVVAVAEDREVVT